MSYSILGGKTFQRAPILKVKTYKPFLEFWFIVMIHL